MSAQHFKESAQSFAQSAVEIAFADQRTIGAVLEAFGERKILSVERPPTYRGNRNPFGHVSMDPGGGCERPRHHAYNSLYVLPRLRISVHPPAANVCE